MKKYCLCLLLLVCSLFVFGSAYTCPGNPIPVHLLGKNTHNNEVDFWEFLAAIEKAPSPDSELLDVDGMWESWFIVDKNRNYFHLSMLAGLIKGIIVDDKCLITEKGVRVGDSFSRVMAVYPNAKFKHGGKFLEGGVFDLLANDGAVEILFAAKIVQDLIKDGYQVDLNDEVVKELKISAIIIHHWSKYKTTN